MQIAPADVKVTAIGGDPFDGHSRLAYSRLLGLAADQQRLLVADFDDACICEIRYGETSGLVCWRSQASWAPAGVGVADDGSLIVLEHRRLTCAGLVLRQLHRARVIKVTSDDKIVILGYLPRKELVAPTRSRPRRSTSRAATGQ
ncbi:MAG TPA: hypothetical protein VHR45_25820 [Thermoanaerobaculia bacterium]|nr:hypothetical protein [Thermoanaerobaculia bacterium]